MPDQAGAVGSASATSPDETNEHLHQGAMGCGGVSQPSTSLSSSSVTTPQLVGAVPLPVVHQSGDVLGLEVIVVDNASTDGSAAFVRERFPGVTVIESNVNLGFGAGCNRAFAVARGRTIILVNPDCELQPGAIGALHTFLQNHPGSVPSAVGLRTATGPSSMPRSGSRAWRKSFWTSSH